MIKMKKISLFLMFGIFLITYVSASNITSEHYFVDPFATGITGGNASGSEFESEFSSLYQQATGIADPPQYIGVTGFFFTNRGLEVEIITPPVVPPVTPPSGGGGPGGGGGAKAEADKFSLNKDELKVKLQQGRVIAEEIIITNKQNADLDVEITVSRVDKFVIISENKFKLSPKESKVIKLNIIAEKDTIPDLYIGEILVSAGGQKKSILTAIEVESAQPLFDIKVKIPIRYNYIMPNEELISEIELYNLGEVDKEVDILVEYEILNWKGDTIIQEQEQLAVNTKISYLKTFKIPEEALFGRYALYVRTTYEDKVASASAWFNVGKPPTIPWKIALIALAIISLIVFFIIFIRRRRIKKEKKYHKIITEKALRKAIIKRR